MMRALAAGGAIAVLVVLAVVALAVSGIVPVETRTEAPEKILVIATAPEEDGAQVAAFAFVLERGSNSAVLLDTRAPVTVAGTAARSAREAYPFGGGAVVAQALYKQIGDTIPWIVLAPSQWEQIVDSAGGIEVDIPQDMSAYRSGELVVLKEGRHRLEGKEVAAAASALDFVDSPEARARTEKTISAGLSAVSALNAEMLPELVSDTSRDPSLSSEELEAFSASE